MSEATAGLPDPSAGPHEPVLLAQLVPMAAAVLGLLAAVGLHLTQETRDAVLAAVVAAVPLLGLLAAAWARRRVTPLAAPRDNTGAPLVRADGQIAGGNPPAAE